MYIKYFKRPFDLIMSLLLLVLLSPLMFLVAIRIRMYDKANVFYKAPRIGLNGSAFNMFKFRTMVVNADKIGGSSTSDDDSRITPVGKILRKYKLDELPQLINVLKGEMSIIGPRPEVKFYTDMFTDEEKKILTIKPGITDYASIWNPDEGKILAGSPDPDKTYLEEIRPGKIRLQLKYLNEKSIKVDLRIIYETVKAIVKG